MTKLKRFLVDLFGLPRLRKKTPPKRVVGMFEKERVAIRRHLFGLMGLTFFVLLGVLVANMPDSTTRLTLAMAALYTLPLSFIADIWWHL